MNLKPLYNLLVRELNSNTLAEVEIEEGGDKNSKDSLFKAKV